MADSQSLQSGIDIEQWADRLFASRQQQTPFDRPTDHHADLNMATAYAIQQAYVSRCCANAGQVIGGFKAALTAQAAQQSMGITSPVVGVLFKSGEIPSETDGNNELALNSIPKLLLETELGFTLSTTLSAPLAGIPELQAVTASCRPTVELASMGFGDVAPTGVDLVSTNSASHSYLTGTPLTWPVDVQAQDLDNLQVSLSRDSATLHSTSSGTLLDGQWHALLWLVNTCIHNGYTIEPEHLLMTGSIGGIHPAQAGNHIADYQQAGRLSFTLV